MRAGRGGCRGHAHGHAHGHDAPLLLHRRHPRHPLQVAPRRVPDLDLDLGLGLGLGAGVLRGYGVLGDG